MNNIHDTLIIIIDKDLNFINNIKNILFNDGFKNIVISNPKSLFKLMYTNKSVPCLIIMEDRCNGFDNSELLSKIKTLENNSSVIITTKSNIINSFKLLIESTAVSILNKNDITQSPKILLESVITWLNIKYRKILINKKLDSYINKYIG